MTLADLFDWFALDSKHVAEQTDDPKQRERWMSWQSCGRPPHDRAVTKRSPATLPPRGLTNFDQAKGRQDNGVPAGFEYVPPIPVRRKGWSFGSRACALNRPRRCSAPVFGTMLGPRNTIEIVFALDETKFRL